MRENQATGMLATFEILWFQFHSCNIGNLKACFSRTISMLLLFKTSCYCDRMSLIISQLTNSSAFLGSC